MKQISYMFFLLLIAGCSIPGAFLGSGNPNISAVKIDLPTIQCGACQQTITEGLKELEGVQTAYVNLNEEKVLIKYDKTRITLDDLKQTIAKLGYQASDVPADGEAYNNLPGCCKLPEDR
ncbi:MAG TPA: heavy metal-associated domain-containing protein [Candidatus Marinimicrobia bacterium]|jgi:copper chaperone CopZ|nr:heavy metal-associated domain-containing protein [Candidatus Neomarinimicrobiota bacterium]MDP6261872.1 heavy metal-associated domain-containing protein [Candidatus Neomarinimicrobiota bacterium]MDP7475652.1 heavy metal-associated domain-containing protein [Candidatus Neomarinimicrobiota bacterium]MEE1572492.1 heavy metal-associated domain-containing protein [Candidatus Neomarinimicrobiota bacterium]HJL77793.1 heavy metal-associated domain-containing protein [Candidatus Neomarinimicrobiota b|tara:strand:+ start:531 stop:890 length:360 start_codon:yes stop_codon:yes gene_type:complete